MTSRFNIETIVSKNRQAHQQGKYKAHKRERWHADESNVDAVCLLLHLHLRCTPRQLPLFLSRNLHLTHTTLLCYSSHIVVPTRAALCFSSSCSLAPCPPHRDRSSTHPKPLSSPPRLPTTPHQSKQPAPTQSLWPGQGSHRAAVLASCLALLFPATVFAV